jgi:hypothetical protein
MVDPPLLTQKLWRTLGRGIRPTPPPPFGKKLWNWPWKSEIFENPLSKSWRNKSLKSWRRHWIMQFLGKTWKILGKTWKILMHDLHVSSFNGKLKQPVLLRWRGIGQWHAIWDSGHCQSMPLYHSQWGALCKAPVLKEDGESLAWQQNTLQHKPRLN